MCVPVRRLCLRQVKHCSECLLGQAGGFGKSPCSAFRYEVSHGNGRVLVLAGDGKGDFAIVGVVRLGYDIVGRA